MVDVPEKFRSDRGRLPRRPAARLVVRAFAGSALTIALLAGLADQQSVALVIGSFGGSCLLVFGYPDIPFSQPRNVVVGHVLGSVIGLTFLGLFGVHWWAVALAVGTTIALMMWTRTVHPPAGSNPVIVFLAMPAWSFVWYPTLAGALLIVGLGLIYNNATRASRYPTYW
jgi:CBS-domain-containing membrane protein